MKKGQFFIISMIFILLGLFALRTLFGTYNIVRRHLGYSSDISDIKLSQISDEYKKLIDFQPENISVMNNLKNFSSFLQERVSGFYHFSFIIFSHGDNLSIVVENFLPYTIESLSMNTSTFQYNFSNVPAGGHSITYINDTGITNDNVTISYVLNGNEKTEQIQLNTTDGEKIYAFLDNFIENDNIYLEKKDFYIRKYNN